MSSNINLPLAAWLLLTITACSPVSSPAGVPTIFTVEQTNPKILGVFEGITPCNKDTMPLPQIPEESDCEQVIWKFTLYQDPASGMPTTYEFSTAYGIPRQNTNGLTGGGTKIVMVGKWDIEKGTDNDPNAVIYTLNPDVPEDSVSFLKIDDDILHVLNRDGTLMVGNGAWSYTINRTDNRSYTHITNAAALPVPETPLVVPGVPAGSSVLGVFDGRTPCHDIVFEFAGITPFSRCVKVKWQLTLYQNDTGAPNTYMFRGTSTIREGTWTTAQGTEEDLDGIIYQLHPNDLQSSTSFLKADDNHLFLLDKDMNLLVGNALFSYTLSRTDGVP